MTLRARGAGPSVDPFFALWLLLVGVAGFVARVIDQAIADLRRLGAEVEEVEIDGLAELLDTYVVLSHEFKFDLDAYLAAIPDAPVSSLAQVLAEGRYHPAVRERVEASNRSRHSIPRCIARRSAVARPLGICWCRRWTSWSSMPSSIRRCASRRPSSVSHRLPSPDDVVGRLALHRGL